MQRRLSYAVIALASSAALVAGCGGGSSGGSTGSTGATGTNNSSQTPSAELTSAFSNLSKAQTLTLGLHLDTDAATLKGIASDSSSTLTDAQANAIAGAKIQIEVVAPSGKTIGDLSSGGSTGAAVDFTVSDNGTNWVTIRSVNKTLYVQAAVKDILDAVGQGQMYAQLQAGVAQAPSFVQALFQGKWVSLPESAASSLTGSSGSGSGQQAQQLVDGLKQILANDVTVTRTDTGTTDTLELKANSRTLASDFVTTFSSLVPQAQSALSQADPSSVPNRDIVVNAGVTNAALSQLSIDFGQFSPDPATNHLPLVVDIAETGPAITAPSGAVQVNTQELGQLFGSLLGGNLGSGVG
ncbi:MAG: hypothetical protein JO246_07915 [Frankiaceae bacterium]|nr:hypothetical protein [Frankiaceae bacterium]MBV9871865.1 hypothetical protein [Frankiaceae bacterium]